MRTPPSSSGSQPLWKMADGSFVSCHEKLKILNQNHDEIQQICQEAYEDALLMGCDPHHFRTVLHDLVTSLTASFDEAPSASSRPS